MQNKMTCGLRLLFPGFVPAFQNAFFFFSFFLCRCRLQGAGAQKKKSNQKN